jgi:hypothetical protein
MFLLTAATHTRVSLRWPGFICDLLHVFDDEAKLRNALGVERMFVSEDDRFECENGFTRLVHRLDVLLKTS